MEKESGNRYYLVTGASTGIGRACAWELDRRGYHVFAGVRSRQAGEKLQVNASSRLKPVQLDVTDAGQIRAAADCIATQTGEAGLAGLVNNAGIAMPGPLELLPIEQFRRNLEVNVIGHVAVTQAFVPLLRKGSGRIVNIGSINGGIAPPYMGAYGASKFAMEAVTDVLRVELRRWGIKVAIVEPGPIDTPIWEKSIAKADEMAANVSPEVLALYEEELEIMRKAVARSINRAAPVERVVRAVMHGLIAKRPKTRYYLGLDVRWCFKMLKLPSDRFRDWLIRRLIGLP